MNSKSEIRKTVLSDPLFTWDCLHILHRLPKGFLPKYAARGAELATISKEDEEYFSCEERKEAMKIVLKHTTQLRDYFVKPDRDDLVWDLYL